MKKEKRYTKQGSTITDSIGSDDWISYILINNNVHCASNDMNFHKNPIIGEEALSTWKNLLDRVNNKKNRYYYQPPTGGY